MTRIQTFKRLCWSLGVAAAVLVVTAAAAAAAPALKVTSLSPDFVTPGRMISLFVSMQNTGTDPFDGNIVVRYSFPVGVNPADPIDATNAAVPCTTTGQDVECVLDVTGTPPGSQLRWQTLTVVDPSATGTLAGHIEVSGAGAADGADLPLTFTVGPSDPFAVKSFDLTLADAPKAAAQRAGVDPTELQTDVSFPSEARVNLGLPSAAAAAPPENFKDVVVHVPPGFVGNPTVTPVRCTAPQLFTPIVIPTARTSIPTCPPESQIGLVQINGGDLVPLWNMVPAKGTPAQFGFYYQTIGVTLTAKLRPSDNGIDIITRDTSSSVPIPKFGVIMWGVPGDPSHNPLRGICLEGGHGYNPSFGDCSLRTQRVPFLRTPTSCPGNPLTWGIDVNTYQHPDVFHTATTTTPAIEGCQFNPFGPSLSLTPSTQAPHAATGVDATLVNPQDYSADGIAPADIRSASVTLPKGLTINPSSADGLAACTDTQLGLGQEGAASCPDASKLGTVTVNTPLLDHPIGGSIFLRTQNSDDPASGELFRLAIEIRSDDDGVDIKLPGAIKAAGDGQLTTVFDNQPQLPFNTLTLHFKTGPRAPLSTPRTCGNNTTNVQLVSWGGKVIDSTTSFTTVGCKPPTFAPTFRAGVKNPVAGSSSPFLVNLNRTDDDSEFASLTINTPKGLLARVKDADQCSNAAANAGNCPAGSLIGHATVGAGIGSDPFYVTNGRVFLTGPYKGGPYGLAVVVDAVAGPFNLGTVVVRQSIHVDPRTAQLSVVSDPFPQVVKGAPLHIRSVRVAIDKPKFMVSPTNCSTQQFGGTATATDGLKAALTSRFQVGGCKNLKFAPKLSLSAGGTGHTRKGNSTPLKAVLTQTPGQSNLRSVTVSIKSPPISALLNVVQRACTLAEYQAGNCRKAEAGSAVAYTPLLKDPLKGGAFFVRHPGRPLPDLMVALRGDIDIDLVGRVTTPGGNSLATNFDTIPDAPVSRFALSIVAGSHGPLGVSGNLCSRRGPKARADVTMVGQNGDKITRTQLLNISGCAKKHRR
jgi:hypothetical protein